MSGWMPVTDDSPPFGLTVEIRDSKGAVMEATRTRMGCGWFSDVMPKGDCEWRPLPPVDTIADRVEAFRKAIAAESVKMLESSPSPFVKTLRDNPELFKRSRHVEGNEFKIDFPVRLTQYDGHHIDAMRYAMGLQRFEYGKPLPWWLAWRRWLRSLKRWISRLRKRKAPRPKVRGL